MKMLLVGEKPPLEHTYVDGPPYDGMVVGSLTLRQLLGWDMAPVFEALAQGLPVILYTPGLPGAPGNRALGATLSSRQRELKSWGVVFTDGGRRRVITGELARQMVEKGERPAPGAVLTPMAKEVFKL